jgi:ribulose-phosphate 3-epimerase
VKIIPAVLAENYDDFVSRLRQAESFTDYIQIDLMDGTFVPSLSFPGEKLKDTKTSIDFEIHLMVKHPLAYMSNISNPKLKKVIFHFESDVKQTDFVNQMRKRGLDTGMAIKPETGIQEWQGVAKLVDSLLFLTVDPGAYGSPFKSEVMKKIWQARSMFKDKMLSVDGGVSMENLKLFVEAGVDSVCVGSRIFLKGNPKENYGMFTKKLSELEGNK